MKSNKLKIASNAKNTAIKIANQYAESYQIIEKENTLLKQEINDLKTNLQINKDMIKDLLSSLKPAQKEKAVIDGLKKEINVLNNTLNFYSKENAELKKGLINNTSNYDLFISKYQKQLDSLTNKCFLMENTISKKDNTIRQLNKKIDDTLFYKELEGNIYIRETYVSSLIILII